MRYFLYPFHTKNDGMILPATLFLFVLIIVLGTGLLSFLLQDAQFMGQTIMTRRAYFAAESGVERALLGLKGYPTLNGTDVMVFKDQSAEVEVSIQNKTEPGTSFELKRNEQERLRLFRTELGANGYENIPVSAFDIRRESGDASALSWKVICAADDGKSEAFQGQGWPAGDTLSQNSTQRGTYDLVSGSGTDKTLEGFLGAVENKAACILHIQNLGTEMAVFHILSEEIPPPVAIVSATGRRFSDGGAISTSRDPQKTITFSSAQDTLSPFFDFGLYYTEGSFGAEDEGADH